MELIRSCPHEVRIQPQLPLLINPISCWLAFSISKIVFPILYALFSFYFSWCQCCEVIQIPMTIGYVSHLGDLQTGFYQTWKYVVRYLYVVKRLNINQLNWWWWPPVKRYFPCECSVNCISINMLYLISWSFSFFICWCPFYEE